MQIKKKFLIDKLKKKSIKKPNLEILKISKFKGNFSFVKQQSRDLSQNDLFCTDDSMLGKKVHI